MRKLTSFLKKNISLVLIFAAAIIGVLAGLSGNLLTESAKEFISGNILHTFQAIFIKIIGYVASPLIFVTIATSIYKMGSFKTFFGRGRRYLVSFLSIMLLTGSLTVLISLPFFGLSVETSSLNQNSFSEILFMLKSFLPRNFWDPFLNINLIQVDVLAMGAGITLLVLGKYAESIAKMLDKISYFLIKIMRIVAKIIPFYILCTLINISWNSDVSSLSSIYKMILLFFAISVSSNIIMLIITSIYQKVSIKKLFLSCLDPYIRAFSTANSTIAMPNQYKSAKHLGVSKTESSFGVPLSISFFKLSSLIYMSLTSTYYYSLTHTTVSIVWLILAVILSTLLTVAIAPVSGGGINNYNMLISELSIDPIYLGIVVTLDPMMDFFITGLNTFMQPLQLLNVASKNKELNHNILRDKNIVLICGAMDVETEWLMNNLSNKSEFSFQKYKCIKGFIKDKEIWVLQTGIGTENAFCSTLEAIKTIEPTELISIGTSGGHHTNLKRGDIIVSNKIINYDDSNERALIPNKDFAKSFLEISNTKLGVVLTSDTWHKNLEEINTIHSKTNSDVEEMESYVSCKVASEHSLNFVALRIVSNNATTNEDYIRETGIDLQKALFEHLSK